MTKQHFIALADAIREHNRMNPEDRFTQNQMLTLIAFNRGVNPRFMADRWQDYIAGKCGPNGGAR